MLNDATVKLLATANPKTVVDAGASDGRYSRELHGHFPDADYVLIDPVEYPGKWVVPRCRWIHKALHAPGSGDVKFLRTDDPFQSGIYGDGAKTPATDLIEVVGASENVFLKLDTHGVEREILQPLGELRDRIVAIQIEVYCFRLSPGCPLFGEIHQYIESKGYTFATLVDTLWRGDGCLWQMDFLYLRNDNPTLSRKDFFYS